MIIYGRNPVKEAIKAGKTIDKVYMIKGEHDAMLSSIFRDIKDEGIVVSYLDRVAMESLTEGGNHQGIAAQVTDFEYSDLDDIMSLAESQGQPALIVIL
ncbi:MAG: RNA methyltransferase substrate-binding domain-containing protein, partial [Clostridia bacterium]